ncbi:MAG: class I SAM-dependent methyltransferase [Parerythrobacter sp.]
MRMVVNTVKHLVQPGNAKVIVNKLYRRIQRGGRKNAERAASFQWAAERAIQVDAYCTSLNSDLWSEAIEFKKNFEPHAMEVLKRTSRFFGGGGAYPLIHFLVRYLEPEFIVETGVAAGWSSHAALAACEKNGNGRLYSSDFPYFRETNAADDIGLLVPDHLRDRWTLDIRGDEHSLPEVASRNGAIDLLHYDSDKSYSGRKFALSTLEGSLSQDAWLIMDDIQDDLFFRDMVIANEFEHSVCEFEGKFLGIIPNVKRQLAGRALSI